MKSMTKATQNAARDRFLAHAASVRERIVASDTFVLDTVYNVEIGEAAGRRLMAQDPARFVLCSRSAS